MSEQRLAPYRRKRDFDRTPEPSGGADEPGEGGLRFVVQRHRARGLHYDFRLEMDGVLASWAVPKGPTLDPSVRRMAIHVEDHPIEYVDFEGVIPRGEYGGGDVIVWDHGTWEPHGTDDPVRAVADGELHADLSGERLRGRFVLVRTGGADSDQWLLLHKHDEDAVDDWEPEDHPRSVTSGRTNDEVRADPTYAWQGDRPAATARERVDDSPPDVDDAEISALADLGDEGSWQVHGRELQVTNLDKMLFPAREGEETTWEDVLVLARLHRTAFERLGLRAQPKVTGRRRIQVWVPIETGPTFEDTRRWVEGVSRTVGKVAPELVSWKWEKKARRGRARLDYTQNAINKTLVAPYSPRPAAGAPVSMPIGWHELDDPELRPDRWTIRTALARLEDVGDPFRGAIVQDQALPSFT